MIVAAVSAYVMVTVHTVILLMFQALSTRTGWTPVDNGFVYCLILQVPTCYSSLRTPPTPPSTTRQLVLRSGGILQELLTSWWQVLALVAQ